MKILFFRSGLIPEIYALAESEAKLPPQFRPWHAEGRAVSAGVDDKVIQAIKHQGYFLAGDAGAP